MNKRVKAGLKNTAVLILYSIFMVGIGVIVFRIARDSTAPADEFNFGLLLITMVLVIIYATAVVYLHIIIHELGHLAAGLLSGYTFMLFRIGSMGIVKEENRFKTISFSMSGTMGQCLMNPPDSSGGKRPYIFYLLGGVAANVITSVGVFLIYLISPSDYLLLFIFIGLTAGVINGIPFGYNDGKILLKLRKSAVVQDQFFQQLKWNGQFVRYQKTYSDVAEDDKIINAQEPITEQFNIYTKLVEMNALLEKKQLEKAYQELSDLYAQRHFIIVPYRTEIVREYLFCLLLLDEADPRLVAQIRSDRLFREHLNTKQVDVFRIKCVIAYYVDNDRKEAEKYYKLALEFLEKAPAFADKELNRCLLDLLRREMDFDS